MAVAQALARGLTTEDELHNEVRGRGNAVKSAIERAIAVKGRYEGYL